MKLQSKCGLAVILFAVILGMAVAVPIWAQAAAEKPAAKAVVEKALKEAATAKKNVFVHFGASWCGWCHKLEAFLAAPEGKLFEDSFLTVDVTVLESKGKEALENPGGLELMKQWGGTGGLPFYVFLTPAGQKLADANGMPDGSNIGYPANPKEVAAFEQLLLKSAPKMSPDVRAKILEFIAKRP